MEPDGAGGGLPVPQIAQGEVSSFQTQFAAVQSSGQTLLEPHHNKIKICSPQNLLQIVLKAAVEGGTGLSQTIIFENTNLRSANIRDSSAKFLPSSALTSMSRSEFESLLVWYLIQILVSLVQL